MTEQVAPVTDWLVFTDLDGTLLDHHTYSHTAARPQLDQLRERHVPVILNSSKTLAELADIAAGLALDSPRIAENGSVVHYPAENRTLTLGADYSHICATLDTLRSQQHYRFRGFHDWEAQEVAEATGLSLPAAARARQRHASEPLRWQDDEARLPAFRQQLQENGLTLKRGGRFWHVMGNADKVRAMQHLADEYAQQWGRAPFLVALGDGPNDRDMLAAADVAVIVHNPDGVAPVLPDAPQQRRIRTTLPGPAGWATALAQLLQESKG